MIRVYLSGNAVHDRALTAFYNGISGDKELVRDWRYEPCDAAVVFGVYKKKVRQSAERGKIIRLQRDAGRDVIILETGYVNRGDGESHHYAAGWNGLNGRADFRNAKSPPERWAKMGIPLRPYSPGAKILLCGQVPWDASVDYTDHLVWLRQTAKVIRQVTVKPVVFRPHPLAEIPPLPDCEYSQGPLERDLLDAHAVVTFNSNTGVDAALFGKPVFAADEGSMVWAIANKNLADLDRPNYPERKQWAADLAHAQWTLKEFEEGQAWTHLNS